MKRILLIIAAVAAICACSKNEYYDGYYDDMYYVKAVDVLTARNFSMDTTVWFIPDKEHALNLPDELSEWQKISIFEIGPHSAYTVSFDSNDKYVTPIETYGPEDSIYVYVFKKEIWEAYSWKELVEGKKWSCSACYSVEDAIASEGVITYPMQP